MTLLDKPWKVDRDGERLYAYTPGEVCIDIVSGAPEDRRKVLELLARVPEVMSELAPLVRFVEAFDAKPIRGIDDALYGIHAGSDLEADIHLSGIRRVVALLRDAGVSDGHGRGEG